MYPCLPLTLGDSNPAALPLTFPGIQMFPDVHEVNKAVSLKESLKPFSFD